MLHSTYLLVWNGIETVFTIFYHWLTPKPLSDRHDVYLDDKEYCWEGFKSDFDYL